MGFLIDCGMEITPLKESEIGDSDRFISPRIPSPEKKTFDSQNSFFEHLPP
jgi:hypothetical protein